MRKHCCSSHSPSGIAQPLKDVMPEAAALRRIRWQFFATATQANEGLCGGTRKKMLFHWLRELSGASKPRTHFKKLLWVARWESGSKTGRGHYHLSIAGLPTECVTTSFARAAEDSWRKIAGSIGEVTLWNPSLDGVGYILKLPSSFAEKRTLEDARLGNCWEDYEPTLSNSLRDTIRRGSM
jgi:hypothetical protein